MCDMCECDERFQHELMIVFKDIAMLLSLVKHTTFHGLSTLRTTSSV